MTSSISNSANNYSDNHYSPLKNVALGTLGVAAGWESETYLRRGLDYPLQRYLDKILPQFQGVDVREYVTKAIEQNNLQGKLNVVDLNESNYKTTLETLDKIWREKENKVVNHIMRIPSTSKTIKDIVAGENACFSTQDNAVICNFKKLGIPVFHEIAHKQHSVSKNIFVKSLSKIRTPFAIFGSLGISMLTLFTNKRDKNDKNYGIANHIKDHCGLYAGLCLLPLTLEEILANTDGTKIAKKAGVTGELLEKVKKCHKMSVVSYVSALAITPIALTLANKIRDYICSFKDKKPANQ